MVLILKIKKILKKAIIRQALYSILFLMIGKNTVWGQKETPCESFPVALSLEKSTKLNQLGKGFEIVFDHPKKSLTLAQKIKDEALLKNDKKVIVVANQLIGRAYFQMKDYGEASNYYRKAYDALEDSLKHTLIGAYIIKQYGDVLLKSGSHDEVVMLYQESVNLFSMLCKQGSGTKFRTLGELSRLYRDRKEEEKLKESYLEAIEEGKKIADKQWLSSAYNNLGMYYVDRDNIALGLQEYQKAKKVLNVKRWEHLLFDVNIDENIAHVYKEQGKWKKAYQLYQNTSKIRDSLYPSSTISASRNSRLYALEMLLRVCELKLADKEYQILNNYYSGQEARKYSLDGKKFLREKMKLLKEKRHYDTLIFTTEEYKVVLDTLLRREQKSTRNILASYFEAEKQKTKEQYLLEKELNIALRQSAQKRIVLYIISSIGLLLVIGVLVLYGKHKKSKANQLQLEKQLIQFEKEHLDRELQHKTNDLKEVILDNAIRQKNQKQILDRLKQFSTIEDKVEKMQFLQTLKLELKQTILEKESKVVLQENIDTIDTAFKLKIETKYPQLSVREKELVCLIKLGMSTQDIISLKSTTISAVKSTRYRIRKKLKLTKAQDLDQFIKEL